MKKIIVPLLLCLCCGCISLNRKPDQAVRLTTWLADRGPEAAKIDLTAGSLSLSMADGSVETKPLPPVANTPDTFCAWLSGVAPLSESVTFGENIFSVSTSAGSSSRTLPVVSRETAATVMIRAAAQGAERAAETGSPMPLVTNILGGIVTLLAGGYAVKKKIDAANSDSVAAKKQTMAEAIINGLKTAPIPADIKKLVANSIQDIAIKAGVEAGPDGLKATVTKLDANLKRGT